MLLGHNLRHNRNMAPAPYGAAGKGTAGKRGPGILGSVIGTPRYHTAPRGGSLAPARLVRFKVGDQLRPGVPSQVSAQPARHRNFKGEGRPPGPGLNAPLIGQQP
jgi:hypothetical protein